jgi:hypothetical protein
MPTPTPKSMLAGAARSARRLVVRLVTAWRDPATKRFRWILIFGLALRLVLAPLTSWASDTPEFILGVVGFLFTGSPYSSFLFFNPPLPVFLEAPFLALVLPFIHPDALVPTFGALQPAASIDPNISILVPAPAALLAVKLPLILGDIGAGIVLFFTMRREFGVRPAELISAAWLLNPLVLWSSSVHAEPDGLAALFMILTVVALVRRRPFACGAFFAFAIFSKAYPIVLLPWLVAAWGLPRLGEAESLRHRLSNLARLAAGSALGSLPFLIYLPTLIFILTSINGNPLYGGMSVLVIYNLASPTGGLLALHALPPRDVLLVLRVLGFGAVAAAPALLLFPKWARAIHGTVDPRQLVVTAAVAPVWCVTGILMSDSSPQSENLVGLVALVLLAAPALGRAARWLAVGLSAAGWGLYLAISGPLAYFYPLGLALGTGAVDALNGQVVTYWSGGDGWVPGVWWLITGLLGGLVILATWLTCLRRLIRGVRDRGPDLRSGSRFEVADDEATS